MLNTIVDLSHHNGTSLDLAVAGASGMNAVIHKATQGTAYTDPCLAANRAAVRTAGLLFGYYHFGTGDDGGAQADYFLAQAQPASGELLALDFEANPAGPSMTLEEARAFVTVINARIGKWPVLYTGHYLKDMIGSTPDLVLANCPLWLAQYGPVPVLPAGWNTWTLWQWTDGAAGVNPQPVPGIGHCDRDNFNGDTAGLAAFWSSVAPD
jgi:lysozyme